jgi:hypothetical protein
VIDRSHALNATIVLKKLRVIEACATMDGKALVLSNWIKEVTGRREWFERDPDGSVCYEECELEW